MEIAEKDRPLAGRTALVTGASRGIGAAIARRLAADGADVVLHCAAALVAAEQVAADCRDLGVRTAVLAADLADGTQAAALFGRATAALGPPDILVNNAGTGRFGPLAAMAPAEIARVLAVNTTAVLLLCQAAARAMPAGGRIVNIGSVIVDMPVADRAAYAASKGAIHALTGVLAQELGPQGIAVACVAPGVTATDRFKAGDAARARAVMERTALGRIGEAADIAAAVAWLCRPDSAWVTGVTIPVHGGLRGL